MELFERVKTLIDLEKRGGKSLAESLGVNESTFKGYLSAKRQHNLWPYLNAILAIHPELSRNWLYFGEGQFLIADSPDDEELQNALDELGNTRQRVLDLEKTIAAQAVALTAQDETLALYRRMETPKTTEGKETAAPGSGCAAPSKHCPIE